ncbi:hypothetical protein FXO38_27100 [Capsicum annuum]|nr:hypothetical protein FXO38_27100 [Capsicum annuum]
MLIMVQRYDLQFNDAEAAGTSQAVPTSNNERMLPQESTNAEQIIAVAGGQSSSHDAAFVNGMDSLYPDVNGEFIFGTDNIIIEEVDTNETGFLVDAGRPLFASELAITRIGSDLEALLTEHRDEDNDINSIFDVGKAPTSHAVWFKLLIVVY